MEINQLWMYNMSSHQPFVIGVFFILPKLLVSAFVNIMLFCALWCDLDLKEIDLNELQLLEELGTGNFGVRTF